MRWRRAPRAMGRRWRVVAIGLAAVAVMVVVLLGPMASVAEGQTSGGIPSIVSAVQGPTGDVVVTWTMPAGHTATNLRWHTSDATVPAAGSSEGDIMACWMTGPSDGKHGCTGGRDQGNSATSYTITGLAPGTYYVQIQTYGLKTPAGGSSPISYNGYSKLYSFTVTAVTTTTTAKPSASPKAPSPNAPTDLPKVPEVNQPKDDGGGTPVGIPNTDCTSLKNAGYLNEAKLKTLEAVANDKNGKYDKATRAKAANAVASGRKCLKDDEAKKKAPQVPPAAKQAQATANQARDAAEKAKTEAADAQREADAKAKAAQQAAAIAAPDAAAKQAAATAAMQVAKTKAAVAAAKAKAAAAATANCKRFTSKVDRRITFKCR